MKWPKDLLAELRAQGFKRAWQSRAKGQEIVVYEKIVGDRKLDVQLWHDGQHRASHWHSPMSLHGCMCTRPTEFLDLAGMKEAILIELTRTDHQTHLYQTKSLPRSLR